MALLKMSGVYPVGRDFSWGSFFLGTIKRESLFLSLFKYLFKEKYNLDFNFSPSHTPSAMTYVQH